MKSWSCKWEWILYQNNPYSPVRGSMLWRGVWGSTWEHSMKCALNVRLCRWGVCYNMEYSQLWDLGSSWLEPGSPLPRELDGRFTRGIHFPSCLLVPAVLCSGTGKWNSHYVAEVVLQLAEGLGIRGSLLLMKCWCWVSKLHWKWVKWRKKWTIIPQMVIPLSFSWCFFTQQRKIHSERNLNPG